MTDHGQSFSALFHLSLFQQAHLFMISAVCTEHQVHLTWAALLINVALKKNTFIIPNHSCHFVYSLFQPHHYFLIGLPEGSWGTIFGELMELWTIWLTAHNHITMHKFNDLCQSPLAFQFIWLWLHFLDHKTKHKILKFV